MQPGLRLPLSSLTVSPLGCRPPPRLVLFSSGAVRARRALGLRQKGRWTFMGCCGGWVSLSPGRLVAVGLGGLALRGVCFVCVMWGRCRRCRLGKVWAGVGAGV